jgi:hypothetical protein
MSMSTESIARPFYLRDADNAGSIGKHKANDHGPCPRAHWPKIDESKTCRFQADSAVISASASLFLPPRVDLHTLTLLSA